MSKILVTGGAGYIGSHTVKELRSRGYKDIIIVDDLSKGEVERIPKDVFFVKGDFADKSVLDKIFNDKISTVLHFAASKSAPESVNSPEKYYGNNVEKSIRLLDRCVSEGVENFIFSSSAAVYGDVDGFPITEDFETRPTNPYGWTKLMFEQVLSDVSSAGKIKSISLRYFNAGGADPELELGNNHGKGEDVVSILMKTARNHGTFTILGTDYDTRDGSCVRDMVHVSDLAVAHIDAINYLEKGGKSTILNLGSESGFTVQEMVKATKKITKCDFVVVNGLRRQGDIMTSIASSEKANKLLGWEQKHSDLNTILRTAWEWENSK